MSEEETIDDIIEIINNEEHVKEAVCETVIEEEEVKEEEIKEEEIKPKPKPKSKSRAKPKVKIVKEPVVEPIVEEIIEPIVIEKPDPPKKVDKLNKIVQCADCGFSMTQHTLKYIHKRREFCKAVKEEPKKTHKNQNQ